MNKIIFIICIASLSLLGCTKKETLVSPQDISYIVKGGQYTYLALYKNSDKKIHYMDLEGDTIISEKVHPGDSIYAFIMGSIYDHTELTIKLNHHILAQGTPDTTGIFSAHGLLPANLFYK